MCSSVSTQEQNDDRQKVNTKDFDYVLSDKISGVVDLWERPRGKQITLKKSGELKSVSKEEIRNVSVRKFSIYKTSEVVIGQFVNSKKN